MSDRQTPVDLFGSAGNPKADSLFLLAPLSPLVGERGWGIEGEGRKSCQIFL